MYILSCMYPCIPVQKPLLKKIHPFFLLPKLYHIFNHKKRVAMQCNLLYITTTILSIYHHLIFCLFVLCTKDHNFRFLFFFSFFRKLQDNKNRECSFFIFPISPSSYLHTLLTLLSVVAKLVIFVHCCIFQW